MGRIREQFPEVFASLNEADARAVETGVQSSVLEGWEPTAEDVQRVADGVTGKLTEQEFMAAVVEAAQRS